MTNKSIFTRVILLLLASIIAFVIFRLSISKGIVIAGALAVTGWAAVMWISEALPLAVTAILIPVGMAVFGVFSANTAFYSFGNPVLFLVLGGYAIAVSFENNGVDKWIARYILGMAGNRTLSVLVAIMLTSALLSMLISNTATTALLLPVVLGILATHKDDLNLSRVLLLGVAYGASIGGVATLIGSPPNAIAAGLLDISFLEWMAFGLPVSFTMLFVAIPILWFTYKPDSLNISIALEEKKALSTKAKRTIKVAAVTLFLWLFGPLITTATGLPAVLSTSASVAMLAIVLLMLSNCLDWKNLEQGVQWGVLLLLGGGLSLGRGLTDSGAAEWLAQIFSASAGNLSMLVLLLLIVSIGVFTTELISNTAITAKLAPIIMGIAIQLGLNAENLVVSMAIASSMAFMLPVATPPNAMVHASGQVLQKDMIKVGIRLNIAAVFVITLLFYFGIAG